MFILGFVVGLLAEFVVLFGISIYLTERKKRAKKKLEKIAVLSEFQTSWDMTWEVAKDEPLQKAVQTIPGCIQNQLEKKPFPPELMIGPGLYDAHVDVDIKFYKHGTKPAKTAWERLDDDELDR